MQRHTSRIGLVAAIAAELAPSTADPYQTVAKTTSRR